MPNHLLTNVIPQIMAQGLSVLKRSAIMPRLVYSDYSNDARERGSTIDIPIIDDATVVAVTPAAFAPTAVTVQPTKVQLSLDWWREVAFPLGDDEIEKAMAGLLPLRAEAAIYALGRAVDTKLLQLYKDIGTSGGVAGTTPFASTATAFLDARIGLNALNAPIEGRNVVLGHLAEGNAVGLAQFFKADERGDQGGIVDGQIGKKYGAYWYLNQGVVTHTMTTAIPATCVVCTAVVTGASVIQVRVTNSAGGTAYALSAGDLFHLANDAAYENYAVLTAVDVSVTAASTAMTCQVYPHARRSYATTIVCTGVATHVPNLYFHPRAFAWATRPLTRSQFSDQLGSVWMSVVDPLTGLAIRLEVSRQYKQTTWSWDILGGALTVRNELAARILG